MAALGRMAWTRSPHARAALLWTHGVLFLAGALACVIGIAGMEAAARSAGRGGGLLGPVAALPLLIGVPTVVLAVCSIAVAIPLQRSPG
jgi:ABC-type Fe3+ transport system permease subunit